MKISRIKNPKGYVSKINNIGFSIGETNVVILENGKIIKDQDIIEYLKYCPIEIVFHKDILEAIDNIELDGLEYFISDDEMYMLNEDDKVIKIHFKEHTDQLTLSETNEFVSLLLKTMNAKKVSIDIDNNEHLILENHLFTYEHLIGPVYIRDDFDEWAGDRYFKTYEKVEKEDVIINIIAKVYMNIQERTEAATNIIKDVSDEQEKIFGEYVSMVSESIEKLKE